MPEKTAAILGALAVRGETYEEIAGFAETMRAKANKIEIKDKNAIDLCGTRITSYNVCYTKLLRATNRVIH